MEAEMDIREATRRYEAWMSLQTDLVASDLAEKHRRMAEAPFTFLRATFYRWAQTWPGLCPELAEAPEVVCVADLHIENFGTWRDAEGRWVWGVNDFDEAYKLPYTNDLVRLATSAVLAIEAGHLSLKARKACAAILTGYRAGIEEGGGPFVLAERQKWLWKIAQQWLRDPEEFWEKLEGRAARDRDVPTEARKALEAAMPEPGLDCRIARRAAGLGSLGRPRFVALADWRGGRLAREAKALLPSACVWAGGGKTSSKFFYEEILRRAVRSHDPCVVVRGGWVVRRLAPDCVKIEIVALPGKRDAARLLAAMGWETANLHLGSAAAIGDVRRDLRRRGHDWLLEAVEVMVPATLRDWGEWCGR